MYFNFILQLNKLEGQCKKPIGSMGDWAIYEKPHPNREYIISADCAEGLEHGDYNVGRIFDKATRRQVAGCRGQWKDVVFADVLIDGANYYKSKYAYYPPLMVVERNNTGHAVLLALKLKEYGNLYYYAVKRAGYLTDKVTRPQMLSCLYTALKNETIEFNDPILFDECKTFVLNPTTKKYEAMKGKHDDVVMASAIAAMIFSDESYSVNSQNQSGPQMV